MMVLWCETLITLNHVCSSVDVGAMSENTSLSEYQFEQEWEAVNLGQHVLRLRLARVRLCCSELCEQIDRVSDAWYTFDGYVHQGNHERFRDVWQNGEGELSEIQRNVEGLDEFKDTITHAKELVEEFQDEAHWHPTDDASDDEEWDAHEMPAPQPPARGMREGVLEQLRASNERLIQSMKAARILIVVAHTILDMVVQVWEAFDGAHDEKPCFTEWWRAGEGSLEMLAEDMEHRLGFWPFEDALHAANEMAVYMLEHGVPLNEHGVEELYAYVWEGASEDVQSTLETRVEEFLAYIAG